MLVFDERREDLFFSQADWKEALLCLGCEQHLSKTYEHSLSEILYLRRKTPIIHECPQRVLMKESADRFALSLLSIFWRGVISTYPEFRYAFVPDYVIEGLRTWILSGKIPSDWGRLVSVQVAELKNEHGQTMGILAPAFFRQKADCFEFVFICGGFMLVFAIPPAPVMAHGRRRKLCPGSQIIWIERFHYHEVAEISRLVDEMLDRKRPANMARS